MNKTALTSIVTACVALAIPGSALGAPKIDGEFPVTNMPRHLTQGPDGNIWVAEGNIAKITPAGQVTEFSPPEISGATGITTGPDGNLWVTQNGGVAKFSPANPNGAVKFAIAAISNANKLTTGPDGNLWTASGNKVIKIPPANPAGATDKDDHRAWTPAASPAAAGACGWSTARARRSSASRLISTRSRLIRSRPAPRRSPPVRAARSPTPIPGQAAPPGRPPDPGRRRAEEPGRRRSLRDHVRPVGRRVLVRRVRRADRRAPDPAGQVTHPVGKFSAGSGPRHIAAGPNNTLWVALEQGKKIGRITGVTPPPAKPAGKRRRRAGDKAAPAITRLSARRTKVRFRLSEKAG